MTFSAEDIFYSVQELAAATVGGRIQRIVESQNKLLMFEVYSQELVSVLVSQHPKFSRIHLSKRRMRAQITPSGFCMFLRSRLLGGRVRKVEQWNRDRIARMDIETRSEAGGSRVFTLMFELTGQWSTVFVLDEGGRILQRSVDRDSRYRSLQVGSVYCAPENKRPLKVENLAQEKNQGFLWDKEYMLLEAERFFRDKEQEYRKRYARHMAKLEGKIDQLKNNLERGKEYVQIQQLGELLKANFQHLKKGMSSISVVNYYDPDQKEMLIPLDPLVTASQNVARVFRKAKKLQRSIAKMTSLLQHAEKEHAHLLHLDVPNTLDRISNMNDLILLEDQLVYAKVLTHPKKKGVAAPRETGFRHFRTQQNFDIWVGRHNRDNDKLTLHFANGNDCWLHVVGFPGSHVVVRVPKNKELPHESLLDAAQLAKYYSKAREHPKSEIRYTPRKYVHKAKGARPGLVTVSRSKTIWVASDLERIERLRHSAI